MKFLIVDDHPLVRYAVSGVIRDVHPEAAVLEAASAADALRSADDHPDIALVLLDLALPGADGIEVLRELRRRHPEMPVVILSASEARADVERALDAGAMGYVAKSSPHGALAPSLQLVLSGGVCVPRAAVDTHPDAAALPAPAAPSGSQGRAQLGLTERQRDVLALLVQGKPTKAICRDLGLSEGTVKNHINVIFRALNVRNRTEAVVAVARLGLQLRPAVARDPPCDIPPQ